MWKRKVLVLISALKYNFPKAVIDKEQYRCGLNLIIIMIYK